MCRKATNYQSGTAISFSNWKTKREKMVSVADIQADLPTWPSDVVEQWLHYFANEPDCGWPPPTPLGDHRWSRLLGGKPLGWWGNVSWEQEVLTCRLENLSPKAQADVADIVSEMKDGSASASTKRRVAQPMIYLRDNSTFPRMPLVIRKVDGWSIIDGAHRMAAFELLQQMPDAELAGLGFAKPAREQNVWVGTHCDGEVPIG